MNLLEAYVTKVLSEPYENYGKWWVDVEYNCWGSISKSEVMCQTEQEALTVAVGYEFFF